MSPLTAPPRLPAADVRVLANGLTLAVVESRRAPIVTTALWYRAGTRDEEPGRGGTAHFLEHMMFKGSRRFGPGEIDRLTRRLGGDNNAFTSHDATVYTFSLAADRWQWALEVEADRMAGLALDPEEVDSERNVILEELAMVEDQPWERLTQEVHAVAHGAHPYARPVLGTRDELAAIGPEALRSFHHAYYRPDNAVLVVAGDVTVAEATAAVERHLGPLARRAGRRPQTPPTRWPGGLRRLERRQGELARLLIELAAPAGDDPDHPRLRLLAAGLATGRASRLHQALVDRGQLCTWVAVDIAETIDPGGLSIAAEVIPGVDPERVEAAVLGALADAATGWPRPEVERAKRVTLADWVFAHERIHQQALAHGLSLAQFRGGFFDDYLDRLMATTADEVAELADRYLRPEEGAVLGWSLPEGGG